MSFMTVLWLGYIFHVRLQEVRWQLFLEVVNEVILLFICYHFVLLHHMIQDKETLISVGNSLQILIYALLSINTIVILRISFNGFNERIKRWCYKKNKS